MKKTYIDKQTGWQVTRDSGRTNLNGEPMVYEAIVDPVSGQEHSRARLGSHFPSSWGPRGQDSIAVWLRRIARETAEFEAQLEQRERETEASLRASYPELARGAEAPDGPLSLIKLQFGRQFAPWDIILPNEDVAARRRGKICQRGWAIWYLFDRNERGEFLDYYSAHRMTGDSHDRLYEDGSCESLRAVSSIMLLVKDEETNAANRARMLERNRSIEAELAAKGFGMDGDEPGGVQIQRHVIMNPDR